MDSRYQDFQVKLINVDGVWLQTKKRSTGVMISTTSSGSEKLHTSLEDFFRNERPKILVQPTRNDAMMQQCCRSLLDAGYNER